MPAPLPTVLSLMLHNFASDALQFANEIVGNCAIWSWLPRFERRCIVAIAEDITGQSTSLAVDLLKRRGRQHRHPAARHHVGHAERHCRGRDGGACRHERVTSVPGQAPDDGTSATQCQKETIELDRLTPILPYNRLNLSLDPNDL
jgi:hypothetical protein